jgi:hypothetical protein
MDEKMGSFANDDDMLWMLVSSNNRRWMPLSASICYHAILLQTPTKDHEEASKQGQSLYLRDRSKTCPE